MKTTRNIIHSTFVAVAFACFGLLPKLQAVVPPPDGGYPAGNTAEGDRALFSLTTGGYNTAVGFLSLDTNTQGNFNTAIGAGTLLLNTTADENTAIGAGALFRNAPPLVSGGNRNTADGAFALFQNTTGSMNTAIGDRALFNNSTANFNTANGNSALFSNTGTGNTAMGNNALANNTTGSGNIALGNSAGSNVTTASNVICIGSAGGNSFDNSCYIGQIFGASAGGGNQVFINSAGKLGTITSSRRFKEEIKPMEHASEALYALKPVTFHYKKEIDPQGVPQFGLVAEDVEQVNPDLVVRDNEGKTYSVRYDQVNAMLLNEFLKAHRKNEEQEKTIAELKSGMVALAATVKEQAAQIQKVSAQLEASKPAPHVVNNP